MVNMICESAQWSAKAASDVQEGTKWVGWLAILIHNICLHCLTMKISFHFVIAFIVVCFSQFSCVFSDSLCRLLSGSTVLRHSFTMCDIVWNITHPH